MENEDLIDKNKYTWAELLIYEYCDGWLIQLFSIIGEEVDLAYNLPNHNLTESELVVLLFKLFESGCLVANTSKRGYFTPSINDIEEGLQQREKFEVGLPDSEIIRFCATGVAQSRTRQLRKLYSAELEKYRG